MKKFSVIFIFLAFILTIGCFSTIKNNSAFAMDKVNPSISTSCKSAFLCDQEGKTVVYSHEETKHLPIASMCKIMTLLLCFDSINNGDITLNDDIVVSENASGMGGSQVFLETNGVYKVSELLKSITVASANDACVAMAEKICGSESEFVNKMNERAKSLEMHDTCFVNCTGLPQAGQFSCAKDVAKMFSELIKNENYFNYSTIWMDEVSHPKGRVTQISKTNNTPFQFKNIEIDLDDGLYIQGISNINELRRQALAEYEEKLIQSFFVFKTTKLIKSADCSSKDKLSNIILILALGKFCIKDASSSADS